MPCYRVQGKQPGQGPFDVNQCWATIRVATDAPGPNGGTLYYFTRHNIGDPEIKSGDCEIANFTQIDYSFCPGCIPPPPSQQYDCINGNCISKATYNTPGVFPSLAACQSGCNQAPCQGECISAQELIALQQAANLLQSKICE